MLWALTWMTNRGVRAKKTGFRDIEHMEDTTVALRSATGRWRTARACDPRTLSG